VDFVLEYGRRILAIEVKRTDQPRYRDAAGLRAFLEMHPGAIGGVLLHGGDRVLQFGEKILAVPWRRVTG